MPARHFKHPAIPGMLAAAGIALAAGALTAIVRRAPEPLASLPISTILVAILLGLALAGVARRHPDWTPGLRFAAGPVLKLGVILIGLRLSLGQLGSLGLQALPLVLGAIFSGLALAWLLGRVLGVGTKLTALLAVGAAICGASAIAATAPALKARAEETAYALACVALFGLAATMLYPWLLNDWLADGGQVGLVLGAAIHDTAQVTAAALLFEQTFGQAEVLAAATVTKLMRNLSMLFVIPAVVWWALRGEQASGSRPGFPLFVLGFLGMAAVRSGGDLLLADHHAWQVLLDAATVGSAFLFATAMAAIGMGIRIAVLRALGLRPALTALLTALGMGVMALLLVDLFA
ncbi:MAG: YeiH family protein [Gammaproteobacteria bacterium]